MGIWTEFVGAEFVRGRIQVHKIPDILCGTISNTKKNSVMENAEIQNEILKKEILRDISCLE